MLPNIEPIHIFWSKSGSTTSWASVSCQLHNKDDGIHSLTVFATKWPQWPCPSKMPQKIMSGWHPNSCHWHRPKVLKLFFWETFSCREDLKTKSTYANNYGSWFLTIFRFIFRTQRINQPNLSRQEQTHHPNPNYKVSITNHLSA